MLVTSHDGTNEIKRATAILKIELPMLPPPPSPGHAAVINFQFDSGLRGTVLDYRDQLWFKTQQGSSSCCLDHANVIADGRSADVRFNFPVGLFQLWDANTGASGWPGRACVRINKRNESVSFFDRTAVLTPQQYKILEFYVDWSQARRGPAPDFELLGKVKIAAGADLRPVISRIRRAFRDAAAQVPNKTVGKAASALVNDLFPAKTPGIGYSLGRPELFQIR